jgi:multiple sugar transport system substrate-binding protein
LDLIVHLRKEGVTPLNFTGQSPWSTLAWFDYLTLRLFGIEKYRALMSGSESFDQASVRQVIDHLDQLIRAKAFDPKHQSLTWQEALPFFYRGRIAMMLNGNFFLAHVPADVREDIGFFPFPNLVSAMPRYENAPTDIAALALQAKNKPHALAFMVFLTSFEAQQMIARYVGKISPHRLFEPDDQYLLAQGKLHLQNAAGVVQYFDRETNADFSAAAGDILVDFMAQRKSSEQVIAALEQARKDFLKTKDIKTPFAITSH